MIEHGYRYVDVRSVPEFESGHPEGALNIPLAHLGPGGARPNADFLEVFGRTFGRDARIVVGCQSGGRSLQAATVLQAAGYTDVVDQRAGFGGGGGERGWGQEGLPTATRCPAENSYAHLADSGRGE